MLKNEPTLAIVAVHTAENEPLKVLGVIQFNFQFGPYLLQSAFHLGRGTYTQIKTGAGFKLKNKNGPFSSVSTATIARVGSFFSIFRDLQD